MIWGDDIFMMHMQGDYSKVQKFNRSKNFFDRLFWYIVEKVKPCGSGYYTGFKKIGVYSFKSLVGVCEIDRY